MAWACISRLSSSSLLASVEFPSFDGRSPVFLLAGKNALAGCYFAAFNRELDSQFSSDANVPASFWALAGRYVSAFQSQPAASSLNESAAALWD